MLDSIGLQQTSFVGSHGGCVVIVDIAVNHPERVKKIVFDGVPYWNLGERENSLGRGSGYLNSPITRPTMSPSIRWATGRTW